MKAPHLATIIGIVLGGCTTSDPIAYYQAHPPQEVGKGNSFGHVDLPPTASPEEVTRAALGPAVVEVLEVRKVHPKGVTAHTAVLLMLKGDVRKIAALFYSKERGGWVVYAFDAH
jgi:hypothetical protein